MSTQPTLPKIIAALASASLLAACPALAGSAAAHPAPRHATHEHAHAHGKAHEHRAHGKAHEHGKPATHDNLAGLRRGAGHAITAQLKSLQRLRTFADMLDLADEGALLEALDADVAAVQADLDGVTDAGSRADLHALMTAAITSRRLGGLQVEVVAAADAARAEAASLGATAEGLAGQLGDMPPGPERDATEAAFEAAMGLLATVSGATIDVVALVLGVSADASRADLHDALVEANQKLDSIETELAQVAADLASVELS